MESRRPEPSDTARARAARVAADLGVALENEARVEPDARTDPYRRSEARPAAPPSRSMVCPRCGHAMGERIEGGVELQRCATCRGLWLELGGIEALVPEPSVPPPSLEELRAHMRAVVPPPSAEVRYLACPRCGEPMSRELYGKHSGVVVDRCPRHGHFLDAGELAAIETFIRLGGLTLERQARRRHDGSAASGRVMARRSEQGAASRWDPVSEKLIRRHLEPGEALVWVGHPGANETWSSRESGGALLGWLAFAGFVAATYALSTGLPVLLLLIVPILAGSLALALAYPAVVIYAITTRRAMILDMQRGRRPRSFFAADLRDVKVVAGADGEGDVILGAETVVDDGGEEKRVPVAFRRVRKVAEVEALVRALANPLED